MRSRSGEVGWTGALARVQSLGSWLPLASAGAAALSLLLACTPLRGPHAPVTPPLVVRFEPNVGQLDPEVRFLARGPRYGLYLTDEGATLALLAPRDHDPGARGSRGFEETAIAMRVVGGRAVTPSGAGRLAGTTSSFAGRDPARWRTAIDGYARVRYPAVLPGVDLVFYGAAERALEYDLVLDPGVDPAEVALAFAGPESVTVEAGGHAVLRLPGGRELRQPPPIAYQHDGRGGRDLVSARYQRRPDGTLGFVIGPYDRARALVIDPVLYATYLGGQSSDVAFAVAADSDGSAYLTGYTISANFPSVGTSLPRGGAVDLFVSKLNPGGTALVYSTYLGGAGDDIGLGIAVDAAHAAYVTGYTLSPDFPVRGPLQAARAGGADAFVAKLDRTGGTLLYATYLGGSADDFGQAIAVDGSGRAHVTGQTFSTNFPRSAALQPAFGGERDAFVSVLAPAGNAFVYSTFLGGSADDLGQGIAVDTAGNTYVGGYTFSPDFPTKAALQATGAAGFFADAFVSKLNPGGTALVYSTYLGGSGDEQAYAIAVDGAGSAYLAGYTNSTNFPTAAPLQPSFGGGLSDGFVSKLAPGGSTLAYSTYFGGDGTDLAYGLAVDPTGRVCLTGYTTSANFPTTPQPFQATPSGGYDGFVSTLAPAGSALGLSSYLGGAGTDFGLAVAAFAPDGFYVAGQTDSSDFPTRLPLQGALGGLEDAFLVRLAQLSPVPSGAGWSRAGLALGLFGLGALTLARRRRQLRR
jgi:hypothetical protein